MVLEIKPLTPDRVDDFFRFFEQIAFAEHPEWGCECYCCFYHATSEQEWKERTAAQNRDIARQMILAGHMSGLLAYADGLPVGWCHYDGKPNLPGLSVFTPAAMTIGQPDAGAIVCFTIAQGYRNRGIAGRLLDAACADLAARGYRTAEAYPRPADCTSVEENYHGPLAMFLNRGFVPTSSGDSQVIVRKDLQSGRELI